MQSDVQETPTQSGAGVSCVEIEQLSKRADFVQASRARRFAARGMIVQGRKRQDDGPVRVGFTCSKKVGNAVARNRAKRRLREVARLILPAEARAGWDYVLIGRNTITDARPFPELLDDLRLALKRLHG